MGGGGRGAVLPGLIAYGLWWPADTSLVGLLGGSGEERWMLEGASAVC